VKESNMLQDITTLVLNQEHKDGLGELTDTGLDQIAESALDLETDSLEKDQAQSSEMPPVDSETAQLRSLKTVLSSAIIFVESPSKINTAPATPSPTDKIVSNRTTVIHETPSHHF
jgi:hypothetical protein